MFLKISKSKGNEYISIAHSYREKGKIKQKIVGKIGRKDAFSCDDVEKIVKSLLKIVNSNMIISNSDNISEEERLKWGCVEAYRKLWNVFDFDNILKTAFKDSEHEFNALNAIFPAILDRLIIPCSKLKSFETQNKYFEIEESELHHFYRSLDLLAEHKEEIEKQIFLKNLALFNQKIDVVFYDVTTYYFESNKADEFKEFGFSKDNKINEVQVMMGLLIDLEGRPIGYELFPGNIFEGNTLEISLDKLKERFNINRVVIVADRGLNSKLNFKKIKEKGYDYIVGSKLKNMSAKVKKEALDLSSYNYIGENTDENSLKYKVIEYINPVKTEEGIIEFKERIICTYSPKRSKKDKKDRERFIEKAKELLNTPSKLNNKRGAKKYIDSTIENPILDEEKIQEDSQWDGIYGIQTSTEDLSIKEIEEAYHQLWKIEESFRVLKTNLEARPIYHWTERRIKGHFVLCFIAFLLERTLELELKKNNISYSVKNIRASLSALELSVINMEDKKYILRSNPDELAKNIFKTLKIKMPQQFEPYVVTTF
jgi:transposase